MPAPKVARLMSSSGLQSKEDGRRGSVVDMTADDVRREMVGAFKVKNSVDDCFGRNMTISVFSAQIRTTADI